MAQISLEEFQKLDIRVGKVISAEKIEGAKKLLKLTVDIGEKRTLVAGIAEYYEPSSLIGKNIVVLTNLQYKKIMGIESQGMILAAVQDGVPFILTVEGDVKPGARVS
ncbi:MAG: methionine--tRNA ligase subunit beta [Thermoproteota archaeon]|nr:methionine--tRNA ligase subunit beta [Candidatus Brockarchaeota archaeon]MBO3768463.1 methionine--tRNA ligase subunit beta [Candidatus Brockarchaeota archaeon]MBO3801299.1 methionine--tRNA ligase subunit beta [Candidatus Brockarchaeota archaeon]